MATSGIKSFTVHQTTMELAHETQTIFRQWKQQKGFRETAQPPQSSKESSNGLSNALSDCCGQICSMIRREERNTGLKIK